MEPAFLKVGRLYLTRDCRVVYEIIAHEPKVVQSSCASLSLTDGFGYRARPCQFSVPFRPLVGARWTEQWYTRNGEWSRAPGQVTDIDLTFDIGCREDYPCDF